MGKCKCGGRTRIMSDMVQSVNNTECGRCRDVCKNPVYGDPKRLSIMAPLIYDEVGINLCRQVDLGTVPAGATNATVKVIDATYTLDDENVQIEALTGRPNCYAVTLTNITIQFAVNFYDANCRLLDTTYPTALYLPSLTTDPAYDADTNPTSVVLEIFAPYGISYSPVTIPGPPEEDTFTPGLNFLGFTATNNIIRQGLNLYGMSKILSLNIDSETATVGLTLVLQSIYFAGYKVNSAGKIDIPKGSIIGPEDSDCMRFVAGKPLNLTIKPLDLGKPFYDECKKEPCEEDRCGCICVGGSFEQDERADGAADETEPLPTNG